MADADKRSGRGSLLIIGGSEDRQGPMEVLKRFVALSGGPGANIAVVTAASEIPDEVWEMYRTAFRQLDVAKLSHVRIDARDQANNPKVCRPLREADGIFMTGGDQKRLLEMIGDTGVHAAICAAYRDRGACVAGTSAGASAMSRFMLAYGEAELEPQKGAIGLAPGMGLVEQIVVDQHFAERQRLPRLLSIIAERPELYGVGIDEDTAIAIRPGEGIEIVGQGAVTVVDGCCMITNVGNVDKRETPRMIDVRLHVLPSGTHFRQHPDEERADGSETAPEPMQLFVATVLRGSGPADLTPF